MAEFTGIGWTDATLNFWHGCKKKSEGCKYCYMYRDKARWKKDGNIVLRTQPGTVNGILDKLREQARQRLRDGNNERIRIFTCSYSDFFIDEADPWREEAWNIIRLHPQFDWQILTKRIERVADCLPPDWGQGWNHVWLGVSAENQIRWLERIPILLRIPARIRFASLEPLIGKIWDLQELLFLDWVILGGESGNDAGPWRYRRAEIEWFIDLVSHCKNEKVPIFVKQLGTALAKNFKLKDRAGANMEEWPEELTDLKIQQFPK